MLSQQSYLLLIHIMNQIVRCGEHNKTHKIHLNCHFSVTMRKRADVSAALSGLLSNAELARSLK